MASDNLTAQRACSKCGVTKPWTNDFFPWRKKGASLYIHCKACDVRRRHNWTQQNHERHKATAQRLRDGARDRRNARHRQWWRDLRDEAIKAYGGACTCCGEAERDFLTLEHENQSGKEHRAKVGGQAAVYVDLKRRGWPKDGFTLLCFNCNLATSRGQVCPHKRQKTP